jgi:hypothetical protein
LSAKQALKRLKHSRLFKAQKRGEKKGKFKFFVAPSVDDFRGLVNYAFASKGKQGEADMKWLEDNLMTPYAKGIAAINGIRQQIKGDFRTAVKAFPNEYKLLNKQLARQVLLTIKLLECTCGVKQVLKCQVCLRKIQKYCKTLFVKTQS